MALKKTTVSNNGFSLEVGYIHSFITPKFLIKRRLSEIQFPKDVNPIEFVNFKRLIFEKYNNNEMKGFNVVKQRFFNKLPSYMKIILDEISNINKENTIVTIAPTKTKWLYFGSSVQTLFEKIEDIKSGDNNVNDVQLSNSIKVVNTAVSNDIKNVYIIDDCVNTGKTIRICKEKLTAKYNREFNVIALCLLFDPNTKKTSSNKNFFEMLQDGSLEANDFL